MIYPIYMYGNTILKKKASKVKKGDIDIKKLSEDMFETMELADGIGGSTTNRKINKSFCSGWY